MSDKIRNNSIDIFRYLCAVMVVAIHIHPFMDINVKLGYVCTQILPRIGVPFFFTVAGYFYVQKFEKNPQIFSHYIKRLLKTYIAWSVFYYLVEFCGRGYKYPREFIHGCLYQFVISGSYYHFWFFPALIFSVFLVTLLYKLKCGKLLIPLSIGMYMIGCLGCSYYELGIKIPVFNMLFFSVHFDLIRRVLLMAFPFFVAGYLVHKIEDRVRTSVSDKKLLIIWGISCLLWLAEIILVICAKVQRNIIITFGLYLLVVVTLLVLLRNPLPKYKKLARCANVMANFTYYIHPFCILCVTFFGTHFLHINFTETPLFILVIFLTGIGGYAIYLLDNKFLNEIVK